MERVANQLKKITAIAALIALALSGSVSAQEQVVEYGRIVQADDGTGSMGYLVGYEGDVIDDGRKPWLPLLSPLMIHLDCWITRMVNINDFYSQQAADEYFAMAESCADIPLSMDPNINMGLKYTVLAPIYAWCPDLLNRCGVFGGCGGYGVPSPMPSVAGFQSGPVGPPPYQSPPVMHHGSEMNLQPLPRAGSFPSGAEMELGSPMSSSPAAPPRGGAENVASNNKWSNMSDEQILAHFGLDPSVATRSRQVADMDGSKLDRPVAEAPVWQFADEAPTVSLERQNMVALNHETFPPTVQTLEAPAPVVVQSRVIPENGAVRKAIAEEPIIELEMDAAVTEGEPGFSTTDPEYDRMREIERDLLRY